MKKCNSLAAYAVLALAVLTLSSFKGEGDEMNLGVRTNLATAALQAPSLGVDLQWNQSWQVTAGFAYGDWGQLKNGSDAIRLRDAVWVEGRHYFHVGNYSGQDFQGLYLGLSATHFRIDNGNKTPAREGSGYGVGPVVGYTFALTKNADSCLAPFTVDLGIGAGFRHCDYNMYEWYEPKQQNRWLGRDKSNNLGLTHAEISIVYHFNLLTK